MSNIKEGRHKPRPHVSFDLLVHTPTNNTAGRDSHEKIHSCDFFSVLYGFGLRFAIIAVNRATVNQSES